MEQCFKNSTSIAGFHCVLRSTVSRDSRLTWRPSVATIAQVRQHKLATVSFALKHLIQNSMAPEDTTGESCPRSITALLPTTSLCTSTVRFHVKSNWTHNSCVQCEEIGVFQTCVCGRCFDPRHAWAFVAHLRPCSNALLRPGRMFPFSLLATLWWPLCCPVFCA